MTVAVAATAAGCTLFGGPSPPGTLGYGLPSPPTAVYGIADTAQVTVTTPAETHDFVIDRRGVVEVGSFPTLSGEAALLFSFAGHAHDLFPRLPDSVMDPGATWPDTVRWHVDLPEAEVTYRATLTHTLVGDTLVNGRQLLRIAVDGRLDNVTVTGVAGAATFRVLRGPVTGFVLWDPERRLVASAEYERDLAGSLERPDRQVLEMSLEGRLRLRLEG